MQNNKLVLWPETLFIFALGLGIFISKPVIYAASGALVALAILRVSFDPQYRSELLSTRLTPSSLGLFVLGLIATLIHPGTADEIAWTARKLLYLPLLPVLFIGFKQKSNRSAGMAGVMVGFWVAAYLTMQSINWQWSGARVAGATWFADVWGVLTGLFVSFLLPRVFQSKVTWQLRLLVVATVPAALIMLLLTGARGPLLGTLVSGLIYFALYQRKTLAFIAILMVVAYFPIKQLLPGEINSLESRIASITHTADPDTAPDNFNASNWIRLQLWKVALAQNAHKLEHAPLTLLFGSGPNNQVHDVRAFYDQWAGMPQKHKELLSSFGYPTNELHNMYLDSTGKMGLLWTIASLLVIAAVMVKSFQMREKTNQTTLAVMVISINFLITGITYDILPHWGSFFLVFLTMLAIHGYNSSTRPRRE